MIGHKSSTTVMRFIYTKQYKYYEHHGRGLGKLSPLLPRLHNTPQPLPQTLGVFFTWNKFCPAIPRFLLTCICHLGPGFIYDNPPEQVIMSAVPE